MRKRVFILVVFFVLAAGTSGCSKSSNSDSEPQLPNPVHIKSECPQGALPLDYQGDRQTLNLEKTPAGMNWKVDDGEFKIDGKIHRFSSGDANFDYVGGCEKSGFRFYAKKGRSIRHLILMPEGDGYSLDSNALGENIQGHLRKVN